MPYDPLYDPRMAELGECPVNNCPPPPVKKLVKFDNGRKTLGQIAMEADYHMVTGDLRMVRAKYFAGNGYVPKWTDLTPHQQQQWEDFALIIAKAIVNYFPEELAQQARKAKSQLPDKVLELPSE